MALTQEQFLAAMRDSFSKYCSEKSGILRVGSRDRIMTLRELKIIILSQMMEIIEYYFRETTPYGRDTNCFTEEEIEDVISHANNIMGTTHYTEL